MARLPLAEAVLTLCRWVADPSYLKQLFEQYRGKSYEEILSFSLMAHLISDDFLEDYDRDLQNLEEADDGEDIENSSSAAYGKMGRLPIPVSNAFLAGCTARLCEVYPQDEMAQVAIPQSLAAYRPIVLEGKFLKNIAKRHKPLPGVSGGLLGGRVLVEMEVRTGLALALHADPDEDANETPLVGNGPRLWMVNSQVRDLTQTARFSADPADEFLVPAHAKVRFDSDLERSIREEGDRQNRVYHEEWGWLESPTNEQRRYVRRIRLHGPGEKDVDLLTSLCDGEAFPAEDLVDLFLKRGGIERVFQHVTKVLDLSEVIGTKPQAAILQFALSLLLYNMLQVICGVIAASAEQPREEISSEILFSDVQRALIAWRVMIDGEATLRHFEGEWTAPRVKARLSELLGGLWHEYWRKSTSTKTKPPRPR